MRTIGVLFRLISSMCEFAFPIQGSFMSRAVVERE